MPISTAPAEVDACCSRLLAEPIDERSAIQLAQAAPAVPAYAPDAPAWSRESIARAEAPAPAASPGVEPPVTTPRTDRALAYRWDRQARQAGYAQPRYAEGASDEGYAAPYGGGAARYPDPREAYGRYAPRYPQPDRYGRYDDEEDGGGQPEYPRQAPGYWGVR